MNIFKDKEPKFPVFPFIELALILLLTAALMAFDPFRVYYKIVNFFRLNFTIFTKEPKLLYYLNAYIGSFIAKTTSIILIISLLLSQKAGLAGSLGFAKPKSNKWIKFTFPFIVLAVILRIIYCQDPLVPNIPIRMVFPEAMLIGNIVGVLSILFIAPFTEEIIFRGYIFDVLKRSFGSYSSVLLTSVIFALVHGPQLRFEPLPLMAIFISGLVFGYFRYKERSIFVPIFFHFLFNLVYIVVGTLNFYMVGY